MKEIVKKYFEYFSNKDIEKLSDIFSEEIVLQDWDIFVKGKKQVLEANKKIFNSAKNISVNLNELYVDGNVATCVIKIILNNKEMIKVIDIIKINSSKKIIEISAYKQ